MARSNLGRPIYDQDQLHWIWIMRTMKISRWDPVDTKLDKVARRVGAIEVDVDNLIDKVNELIKKINVLMDDKERER